MADETGIVLGSSGGKARIRLNRRSECSTCGGCFFSETARFMIAEAEDPIGVRAGDTVRITNRINATRADSDMASESPIWDLELELTDPPERIRIFRSQNEVAAYAKLEELALKLGTVAVDETENEAKR